MDGTNGLKEPTLSVNVPGVSGKTGGDEIGDTVGSTHRDGAVVSIE